MKVVTGLSAYRRALSRPGALAFSVGGFLARMPMAMMSLGIILLVVHRTGSYSQAGSVSAVFLGANALCAVAQARWIDRLGQGQVLPPVVAVFALGLVGLMVSVDLGAPRPYSYLCAAVAGATLPQIGSSIRARWAHLVTDKAELHAAFAFESVLDELIFMLGPALVTVLTTVVHPLAGLTCALVTCVCGTAVLVGQRGTAPPVTRERNGTSSTTSMPWRILGPLVGCAFTMGVLLGGAEVATVAFCEELGVTELSGVALAIWAVGSLVSGVATGALRLQSSTAVRFRWSMIALGGLVVPLPFVATFPALAAGLFISGFAISPTLVTAFARIEEAVPINRMTEGITLFTTGLGVGLAPGAAISGWIVESAGASAAFWVPVSAGLLGAATAIFTGRTVSGGGSKHEGSAERQISEMLEI